MSCRRLILLGVAAALIAGASPSMAGQAQPAAGATESRSKAWTPPRTAWGDPDLQGIWVGLQSLSLERSPRYKGREFLTDAEIAAAEARAKKRDAERLSGTAIEFGHRNQPNYNAVFQGTATTNPRWKPSKRTSAIIDPPNGRLPEWTPEQIKYYLAFDEASRGRGETDSPEDRSFTERCFSALGPPAVATWGLGAREDNRELNEAFERTDVGQVTGGGTVSAGNIRIMQGPGFVAMVVAENAWHKIIPLDGRPALGPNIRQWHGDSRGRFEGNTLVVETTNVLTQAPYMWTYDSQLYPGSGKTLRVIERYTPIDAETLEYRYTIDDPGVYTRPYTVSLEMVRDDGYKVTPFLCHENNRDMAGMLAFSRADQLMSQEFADESRAERQRKLDQLKIEWAERAKQSR